MTENQPPEPSHVPDQETPGTPAPGSAATPDPTAPQPSAGYAPPASFAQYGEQPKKSHRTLWLAVGAGVAVAAVGLGGVAVGAALAEGHGPDHAGSRFPGSPMGDEDGTAPGAMPGGSIGDVPGGLLGGMGQGGMGQGGMLGGMPGLLGGGPQAVQHADLVFQDASGDYVTLSMQQGQVTSVSSSSISVDSADGFTQTYSIDSQSVVRSPDATSSTDGLSGIQSGDSVRVIAQDSGNGPTARLVLEDTGSTGGRTA